MIDPEDVVALLGLTPGDRRAPAMTTATPGTLDEHAVITALGGEPASVDDITTRTGLEPGWSRGCDRGTGASRG